MNPRIPVAFSTLAAKNRRLIDTHLLPVPSNQRREKGTKRAQLFIMLDAIAGAGKDIQTYLDLLSLRQKLTASNIANVDTPGYKTQDIEFHEEFRAALQGESSPRIVEARGLVVKNDGNNVSLDREARMLSETALRFNIGLALLKGEIEDIRKAIRSDS